VALKRRIGVQSSEESSDGDCRGPEYAGTKPSSFVVEWYSIVDSGLLYGMLLGKCR